MRTFGFINNSNVTATTYGGIKNQLLGLLEQYGYPIATNDMDILEWLHAPSMEDVISREIHSVELDGGMNGDYQETIRVIVFENYSDSGSEDYIYTISVLKY